MAPLFAPLARKRLPPLTLRVLLPTLLLPLLGEMALRTMPLLTPRVVVPPAMLTVAVPATLAFVADEDSSPFVAVC